MTFWDVRRTKDMRPGLVGLGLLEAGFREGLLEVEAEAADVGGVVEESLVRSSGSARVVPEMEETSDWSGSWVDGFDPGRWWEEECGF